ncbi:MULTISPECIES: hypothetical protein [unclassified Streptomyces]|uniref:hypothetical protein n=1 Tax=unclassified Streptomyces TaxID=2593676 RepID=UPI000DAEB5BF|nr:MULTISPECIES: hypothetical protein [unclassified Streptomyces]PZT75158.1 hypothetical protein DNK55_24445 [Streptomyces sp. AC1-42T]PZT81859.1 hypothetical protein DNK56_07000 [Streptomyces sp. AC1-42W]
MAKKRRNVMGAAGAAAAVALTALTAAPAGAASGAVTYSGVSINGGKPIVIGIQEEVTVPVTYRMTTSRTWDWPPVVYLYRGKVDYWKSDSLRSGFGGSDNDCPVQGRGSCVVNDGRLSINPTVIETNGAAGTWKSGAYLSLPGGAGVSTDLNRSVQVQRATRVTVNAAPEPVIKGRTITVTGKVSRANWEKHTYQGYGGRTVSLQFKADGASSYTTVKKATSSSTGALRTTVKATTSGTWRWKYYGNSTSGAKASSGDHVVVWSGVRIMHAAR